MCSRRGLIKPSDPLTSTDRLYWLLKAGTLGSWTKVIKLNPTLKDNWADFGPILLTFPWCFPTLGWSEQITYPNLKSCNPQKPVRARWPGSITKKLQTRVEEQKHGCQQQQCLLSQEEMEDNLYWFHLISQDFIHSFFFFSPLADVNSPPPCLLCSEVIFDHTSFCKIASSIKLLTTC